MAVQFYKPQKPLNKVLQSYVRRTVVQLMKNTKTQHVFPIEVYPGYRKINAAKPNDDPWKSTGEGVRSFSGRIISGDEKNPWDIVLRFEHRKYLKYVDLGVGKGTKLEKVDNSRKARYDQRYISSWDRPAGHSQRPAIMMEMRHLQASLGMYMQDYLGLEIAFKAITNTLPSEEVELIIAQWG